MRWGWLGIGEQRWKKSPDEEVRPPKTLWDFLQLLIIPALLAAIAVLFNASQASRDRTRDENTRRDATLDAYFASMTHLMLDRHLLTAEQGSPVQALARTLTLTTLRRLDGGRKGEVIRFLAEGGLLRNPAAVYLERADLRGADLAATPLYKLVLYGTDFRGAKFDDSYVSGSSFAAADLRGASFAGAIIDETDFTFSDLTGASFDDARFSKDVTFERSCLYDTSFAGAHFGESGTVFLGAEGRRVDFRKAEGLSDIRLAGAYLADVRLGGAEGLPGQWRPIPTPHASSGPEDPGSGTKAGCRR